LTKPINTTGSTTTPVHKRKGSWGGTVLAVLWAFLGVRRKSDYEDDIGKLNPLHLALVGFLATCLFVGGLMLLVNWVVANP
jgi:hypothetical protein